MTLPAICLVAAGLSVPLGSDRLTLAWTHSVEKTEWQEDWQATDQGLVITQSRVKGSGAGMEPPADAVLREGFWQWRPVLPAQPRIILRRSGATADWRVCVDGRCRAMDALIPEKADPVVMESCGS